MNTTSISQPGLIRRLGRALSTPFDPEDYLALFDPLQSARETRARVRRINRETDCSVTLELAPNRRWAGHRAGQHVLLGVDIDGVRQQRCFSLSSAPGDRYPAISVKANGKGGVSDYLVHRCIEGEVLVLGEAAGVFVLPESIPEHMLMVTAGSGITPVHSIVRHLLRSSFDGDLVWIHFERGDGDLMRAREIRELGQDTRLDFRVVLTAGSPPAGRQSGRLDEHWLTDNVADAADRTVFSCGPAGFLDTVIDWHQKHGRAALFHERFQAPPVSAGEGGRVRFAASGGEYRAAGVVSLLEVAEAAGLSPKNGCRMGICHTCKCQVKRGRVRDLQSGVSRQVSDEAIRICIHAADGDVELNL